MTFPQTPRRTLVEMYVNNAWTNITSDVRQSAGTTITRGKSDEGSQTQPGNLRMTVNNRAGKYSPHNALGQYYGQIGRNTQIRDSVEADPVFDAHSAAQGTGNLSWTHTPVGAPTGVVVFVWQYNTSTGQINSVTYGGVPMDRKIFGLCTMGASNAVAYMYFLNRAIPTGPQTVVVDTSAVIMRQASVITVTGGTTAEIDSTRFAYSNTTPSANPGMNINLSRPALIFGTLLSNLPDVTTLAPGIGYTLIANYDLGTEVVAVERSALQTTPGGYSLNWTAASGHWSIMGVTIRAVTYRFWGEVSAWPAKWDTSGRDAWVELEAAGIMRRIGQGSSPAASGLKAFTLNNSPFRYWPLGGKAGTQYSLDISPIWDPPSGSQYYAQQPASFKYGEDMGAYLGTGMALFNTGPTTSNGAMRGDVGSGYANTAVDFVLQATELGNLDVVINDYNGPQWTLNLGATVGKVQVQFNDGTGVVVVGTSAVLPALTDGAVHHARLSLIKSGTGTDWAAYIDGVLVTSGTQASYNLTGHSLMRMYYSRTGTQTWVNLAHVTVWAAATASWPSAATCTQAAQGYAGEAAGTRIKRIAALIGYPLTAVGDLTDTALMGPQYSESLMTQLRDAESTDLGVLAEPRAAFGLQYRTLRSHFNQAPSLTLDYSKGQIAPPFEPIEDDQTTRNDITVSRREGDSYQAQQLTGQLSVKDPPAGVGRYADSVTVNVQTDDLAAPVAGWLLHRGTLDEARYPSVKVDLANPNVVAAGLEAAVLRTDLGDRIVIRSAAHANIYDDISLIVLGYTERINTFEHNIVFNCAPGSVYEVMQLDDPESRISPGDTSQLNATMTTTATTMSVLSADAVTLWTTAAGDMPIPIMVAGEEMTVTAITGTTPGAAQTFTVTRSVNGVVKTHASGEVVRLKRDAVLAL